jgi:hypothetical protein
MQIGGFILAKARIAAGRVHSPSPQINPEATAGIMNSALLVFRLCHTKTIKLPTHISMAKEAPMTNGTAMTNGRGTHCPIFRGKKSLTRLTAIAKAKKPQQSCKQYWGRAEKPSTPMIAMFL